MVDTETAGGLTLILIFVVCGMIVLGMIGIALYGAKTLPWDARINIGRGGWRPKCEVPKPVGLVVFPAFAAILYGILLATGSSPSKGSHQSPAWAILAFVILALIQLLTIKTARDSGSTD